MMHSDFALLIPTLSLRLESRNSRWLLSEGAWVCDNRNITNEASEPEGCYSGLIQEYF
jgi:hypothetical protein